MRSKNLFLVLIIIVFAIVAIIFFNRSNSNQQTAEVVQEITEPSPKPKVFNLSIKQGQLENPENQKLTVIEGEKVTIEVTSDDDAEFHLHGYDILVEIAAGETKEINFVADISGRFEFELEEIGSTLGALEVLPQ